jgi:hypothetical protein
MPSASATVLPTQVFSSPTPIAKLEISDLTQIRATDISGARIVGLVTNVSDHAVRDVVLSISISERIDSNPIVLEAVPLLWHLESGEVTPFAFELEDVDVTSAIEVQVSSYQPSDLRRTPVEFSDLQEFPIGLEKKAILATIINEADSSLIIHRVGLLAIGSNGLPLDLITDLDFVSYLQPEAATPLLATINHQPENVEWKIFADTRPSAELALPTFTQVLEPTMLFTEQGIPYILGALQNDDDGKRELSFLVLVKNGNQLVGLSQIRSALPVPAQGTFIYTTSPTRSLQMLVEVEDPEALTLEIAIDRYRSAVSERTTVELPLQITSLETIGSSMFIKGVLTNTEIDPISSPSLLVEVRDLSGALLTGGWFPISSEILSEVELDFVVDLPIPGGFELAQSEIDIRSIGIHP